MSVVADSCNPIELTREWEAVAQESGAEAINIEVFCSDYNEYRRRVEIRTGEIAGMKLPTLAEVEAREYHPRTSEHITIDTADHSITESFKELKRQLWK